MTEQEVKLRDLVVSALNVAYDENDYTNLATDDPFQVAISLCDMDYDIENCGLWQDPQDLVPFVKEWQATK